MMTTIHCEDCRQLLPVHERGELESEQVSAVEEHLAHCTACASELARLRQLCGLLDQAEQPSPRVQARVMASAAHVLRKSPRLLPWWRAFWSRQPLWATCYSLVLLGGGVLTGQLLPPGSLGLTTLDAGTVLSEERLLQICPIRDAAVQEQLL